MNRQTIFLSSFSALFGLSLLATSSASALMGVQINDEGIFIRSNRPALNIHQPQKSIIYPSRKVESLNGFDIWQAMPQRSPLPAIIAGSFQQSFQKQGVGIELDRNRLQQPLTLAVSAQGSQVTGKIQINGKTIKTIQSQQIFLNISPYLRPGTNTIAVSGSSQTPRGAFRLELSGHGHHLSQQTSGNSQFMQNLTITVR